MKQETYFDRLKKVGCVVWVLFGLMELACALLIVGGSLLAIVSWNQDPKTAEIALLLCVGTGVLGGGFFAFIALVLPYIQYRKGITAEGMRAWPSGVLTDAVIRRDLTKKNRERCYVCLGTAALLAVLLYPLMHISESFHLLVALLPPAMLIVSLGFWIQTKRQGVFRVEEDTVVDTKYEVKMDLVDAVTTHMPDRVATLKLKFHGNYKIDIAAIHNCYTPKELTEILEKDEGVYVVYPKKGNRILYIYRKKYWTREEKTQ